MRPFRLLAGGLLLLAALQPAHAQPGQRARAMGWGPTITGHIVFDAPASEAWIPIVTTPSGLVTIRGRINGKPVLALVDTGAPYTALDEGFARRNGIALKQTVTPGRNRVRVFEGTIQSMQLGPVTQNGGRLAAVDLAGMGQVMRAPIQMILGADYLRNMAVEFDFDRVRMRLRRSGSAPPAGITVPLGIMAPANRFIIGMTIGDVPVNRVLIDTGINATLSVTTAVWKRLPLAGVPVTSAQAFSLYGPAIWPLARFEGAAIGPARIGAKIDVLADPDGILDTPADGLIGMEALRFFNVFLDAKARIMTLSPRSIPHVTPPPSTIGVLGNRVERGFQVGHVMKNSPAARAGIADGDVICSINGDSIANGTPGARENWAARPVGTVLALGLCSGRTVTVTLANFY